MDQIKNLSNTHFQNQIIKKVINKNSPLYQYKILIYNKYRYSSIWSMK